MVTAEQLRSRLASVLAKPNPPTAIVVPDSFIASALFRLCYEESIRVPGDLSVAATADHTPHSHPVHMSAPDSNAVIAQVAEEAARYLGMLMSNEQPPTQNVEFRSEVQWKDSVAEIQATQATH